MSAAQTPKNAGLKKAMVLAAGKGLRMRPLTLTAPKPLLPVWGRTLLDHALDRLAEAGVTEAVVNAHHLGHMIGDHLRQRAEGPRTILSMEPELLETGGGVRRALPQLGGDPFFVVNADVLWLNGPQSALARLSAAWRPAEMDALLLLMPTVWAVGYEGRGDFQMAPDGRLTRRQPDRVAPFVFAGVHIVKPELYRDTPEGPFSNNLVWDRAEAAGRLFGLRHDGEWYHVGTPQALAEVNALRGRPVARWAEP
jgi:MurNAc alpha-1-phosphate uridylyltransferase